MKVFKIRVISGFRQMPLRGILASPLGVIPHDIAHPYSEGAESEGCEWLQKAYRRGPEGLK
jgi:hypothetical protein|tara:strand:+ start:1607 stop:1789 length:183 start_codon:yes stop_codon:yes gene_type:complete